MDIGQAIRLLRKSRNMTQKQLAECLGVSVNAVCSLETGKAYPTKTSIGKLCKAFDIPQSYVLMASIEEEDVPEDKRVLYRALIEPLRNELLGNNQL